MKKIVFGITSLSIGGAERVLVDIANKLQEKYDITIFTLYGKGVFEKELNKNIKLIKIYEKSYEEFNGLKKRLLPILILKNSKKIYEKYINDNFDIQIAFLEGPVTRIFKYGKNKKISWIHNDISQVFGNNLKAKLKIKIDKNNYKMYNKLIFVSEQNKIAFNKLYRIDELKEEIINNYINKDRILELAEKEAGQECIEKEIPSIVVLSRLVEQKAIDRLIKIHKKLITEKIDNIIYVIGDGPERKKLENIIKEEKVEKTFKLLGKKENPYPYVKKADYLALLSYFEGYPMCLEEAKILNKKILITDTASKEVVRDYKNKVIIKNDEESIYKELKRVLQGEILFEEEKIEYDNQNLINKIEKVIDE